MSVGLHNLAPLSLATQQDSKHRISVFLFYWWGNWHQMSMSNLFNVTWQSGFKCRYNSRTIPLFTCWVSKLYQRIDGRSNCKFYNEINSTVFIKNQFMHNILYGISICIMWNIHFYVHKSFKLLSPIGLGRSPGEGNGCPVRYSCLENSMDRGAWWATVHVVSRLGHDWVTNTFFFHWERRILKK